MGGHVRKQPKYNESRMEYLEVRNKLFSVRNFQWKITEVSYV